MRYAGWAIVALILALLPKASARAQNQPCSTLQAIPGESGYQHRPASDRCEGLYQSPVAGESLEFLSFASGGIRYDLTTDKVLVVAVPDVTRLDATEVSVRARALPLSVYYRMDATVPSAKSIEWPLSAVIIPARLPSDSIGAIGWIEKGGSKTFVPVSVVPKGKSPPPQPQHTAIAVFRSTVDIERVQWRLWATDATNQPHPYHVLIDNAGSTIRAGEPIRLSILGSSQPLNLEIAAKMTNSDEWLKVLLRVFVP